MSSKIVKRRNNSEGLRAATAWDAAGLGALEGAALKVEGVQGAQLRKVHGGRRGRSARRDVCLYVWVVTFCSGELSASKGAIETAICM